MKKGILILSMLSIAFAAVMQAQEPQNQPQEPDSIKGVHPYKLEENAKGIKPEIAHWSIIPHIGFSSFDGDFTSEMKHTVAVPSVGLAVEYNFTPTWSVGVEYMYDMYTVTGKGGDISVDTLLNGHMHKAGAYVAFDIINLFFPRVQKKIFSLHPYVGAGGAWYKRSHYFKDDRWYDAEHEKWVNPTHGRNNTQNYVNEKGEVGIGDSDKDYRMVGYLQMGASLDFNLNRTLALGLRANYTYFTRDYVDGRGYHKQSASSYASKNNDGIFDITAYLRFKLEAVSKSHPRNMPSFDTFDKMLAKAEPKEPCHDTIIYHFDSIIVREKEIIKQAPRKEVYNVYFDNDKYNLRQDALVTIQQVADRMENEPDLYAVVIGYCDNTGGNGHNFTLGDNRADIVVDELVQEYNLPADHLFGKGSGKLVGRRSTKAYGPNRRSAIHLVDKETFELMKLQLEDNSDNRDESIVPTFENSKPMRVPVLEEETEVIENGVKTVALAESARKEKINEYKTRAHEMVTVEKGMTLSKLARKYYDNTFCWVYIYIANREQLNAPTDLQEGMEIMIPELTEEELKTESKDCLRLYSIAAHNNK